MVFGLGRVNQHSTGCKVNVSPSKQQGFRWNPQSCISGQCHQQPPLGIWTGVDHFRDGGSVDEPLPLRVRGRSRAHSVEQIRVDWQGGFEVVGDLAAGFVGAADDVDGGFESGGGRGVAHQADDGLQCVEQDALAGATDVREVAAFDRVVLRAVARDRKPRESRSRSRSPILAGRV